MFYWISIDNVMLINFFKGSYALYYHIYQKFRMRFFIGIPLALDRIIVNIAYSL